MGVGVGEWVGGLAVNVAEYVGVELRVRDSACECDTVEEAEAVGERLAGRLAVAVGVAVSEDDPDEDGEAVGDEGVREGVRAEGVGDRDVVSDGVHVGVLGRVAVGAEPLREGVGVGLGVRVAAHERERERVRLALRLRVGERAADGVGEGVGDPLPERVADGVGEGGDGVGEAVAV